MNLSMIAAIGKNNELGKNGTLIWNIKGDMKFFKETTMGHPVVMGGKTFESLPKVLPGRKNIVISNCENIQNNEIELYKSLKSFLENYKDYNDEIFIIGGASIYSLFINLASKLYLTEIDAEDKQADVYFPKFDKSKYESTILLENQENNIKYKHVLYKKR